MVRNRLRRRLRAICADLDRTTPDLMPSGALLISAGSDAVRHGPAQLRDDVIAVLRALPGAPDRHVTR